MAGGAAAWLSVFPPTSLRPSIYTTVNGSTSTAQPDQIVIRKATPHRTLQDLFAGRSADEWRALYADAFDWGPDAGREIV